MTFASRRFEVKANPWGNLGTPGLANLSDLMPGDDERLKWIHTNFNKASFNPVTGEFYPNFGRGGRGGGGGGYDPMLDRIPRISPINEGMLGDGNSNNCPAGFYQFGNVCVPSVDTRGGSGSDLAGQPGTFFGKGDGKGIINAITPPQFTAKNQEFIVMTDMQNIGGQPAKFYTKIAIPDLNITGDVSNSTMVMPLAKTKIGHRIIMPLTVTSNNLLNATVELIRIPLTSTGAETTDMTTMGAVDDRGTVSIPSPNYRGPMPPVGGGLFGTPGSGFPFPQPGMGGFPPMGMPPMGFPPMGGPPPMPPGFPGFPPSGPIYPGPFPPTTELRVYITPFLAAYPVGSSITVSATGFNPSESCQIQIYSTLSSSPGVATKYYKRLVNKKVEADATGRVPPTLTIIPNTNFSGAATLAIIVYGNSSKRKAEQLISAIGGTLPTPIPGGGSSGSSGGSGFPFGNIFGDGGLGGFLDNIFDRVGIGGQSGQNVSIQNPGGSNQQSNQNSNVIPNFNFGNGFPFNQSGGSNINPAQNTQGFINDLFSRLGMR